MVFSHVSICLVYVNCSCENEYGKTVPTYSVEHHQLKNWFSELVFFFFILLHLYTFAVMFCLL